MKHLVYFGNLFIALWFIVILLDVPSVNAQSCDPRCEFPHKCQPDIGKCLCVVGFTGPNAFYIEGNYVLADFCNRACFYNIFFRVRGHHNHHSYYNNYFNINHHTIADNQYNSA